MATNPTSPPTPESDAKPYRRMWSAAWAVIGLALLLVALFGTLEVIDLIYNEPIPSPQALPGAE